MTLPTKDELDGPSMLDIWQNLRPVPERDYILKPAGVEHYRLLKWFGDNFESKRILELGHYMGLGTLCLANSGKNLIYSADLDFKFSQIISLPENVRRRTVPDENFIPHNLYTYDIIFVDTWHNGIMEKKIFDRLNDSFFSQSRILIFDDIHLNDAMQDFWASIPDSPYCNKIDATHIGHSTGTGIIEFI